MQITKQKPIPLGGLFHLISLLTIFLSLISAISSQNHYMDLISHLKQPLFFSALIFGLLSLWYQRWLLLSGLSAALIVNTCFLLPWYLDRSQSVNQSTDQTETVKIFHANLLSSNSNDQALLNQIDSEKPDLLLLQEVSPEWEKALRPLTKAYPHFKIHSRPDNFGIAILSRLPLETLDERDWGKVGVPSFLVRFRVQSIPVHLAYTHPLPPINKEYYRLRNIQLDAMLKEVSDIATPIIVAGDLNLSMWSSYYPKLETAGLTNVRKGFGILPTWPATLSPLGLPIDHILISKQLHAITVKNGDNIDSDHLPLLSEIRLN